MMGRGKSFQKNEKKTLPDLMKEILSVQQLFL